MRSARRGDYRDGSGVAPGCLRYAAWFQGWHRDIPKSEFSAGQISVFLGLKSGRYRVKTRSGETFEGGSGAAPGWLKYAAWSQGWHRDIPKFDFQKFSADGLRLLSPSVHLTATVLGIAGRTRRGRICMPD